MAGLARQKHAASVRWIARPRASLRRSALPVLVVAAVMGVLIATVAVVTTGARSKDRLREAQIALVQEPAALFGIVQSPQALLAGEKPDPTEFPLSEALRDRLVALTATTERFWATPLTRRISGEARQVGSYTAQLMTFVAGRRLGRANAVSSRQIAPLAGLLGANVATATAALQRQITRGDQTSWILTLSVAGLAGALLLALVGAMAVVRRRSERTRIEHARTEIESHAAQDGLQRLQALVEHGSDIIIVVGSDATVVYQVGAIEATLGRTEAISEGGKLTEWVAPEDRQKLLELCGTAGTARHELRMLHRDGRTVTCEASAASLVDHVLWGNVVVLNMWDVTGRKTLEERLRHQAFHDQLTRLPNRALVLDFAERMLARATRQSTSVVALYIDLDGFKTVNDEFGHAAGDELLRVVGTRLAGAIRANDLAGRLGGDEFIVLLDGFTLDVAPEAVAERLLADLREPVTLESAHGSSVCVNASVGIATARGGTADDLLRDADLALYAAKDAGKGRYAVFSPVSDPVAAPGAEVALELQART